MSNLYLTLVSGFSRISISCSTLFLLILAAYPSSGVPSGQTGSDPEFYFTISFPDTLLHGYHVDFKYSGFNQDTLEVKMPQWMPGYYQIMNYAEDVRNITAADVHGNLIPVVRKGKNGWQIAGVPGSEIVISYDISTRRKFVANSYTNSSFAYILPENTFLYVEGLIKIPVTVRIESRKELDRIATGLDPVGGTTDLFYAPDFDILYDCPILIGDLEELPSFEVDGIEHRFIAYKPGSFDQEEFSSDLKNIVEVAVNMFGEVPYESYTFLGLGPGRGGIEHLNNTTISFDGNTLNTEESRKRMLSFIVHEYFHHYNVKRIRPYELGPFDYDRENRTNQLWVSEGLTVYYEYLLMRRAGLIDENDLLAFLAGDINAYENDSGKVFQSLREASYYTWEEGPFGTRGGDADSSISYYEKGCVLGLLLDFQIRYATRNMRSLDDVMRHLYMEYYKKLQRGFTDAEFQQACETVAGIHLTELFAYIYTTKGLEYQKYLDYAGLQLEPILSNQKVSTENSMIKLTRKKELDQSQEKILRSWQEK